MKSICVTIIFICLFSLIIPIKSHCDELNIYEINARDFSFEGAKFGMSRNDVKKIHPEKGLLKDQCDNENNYIVTLNNSKASSGLAYGFFDNKLCEMRIAYDDNKIMKLGGLTAIMDKIIEKFGKCDDSKGEETLTTNNIDFSMHWDFQNSSREVYCSWANHFIRIDVKDTDAFMRLSELRKSKTSTGF